MRAVGGSVAALRPDRGESGNREDCPRQCLNPAALPGYNGRAQRWGTRGLAGTASARLVAPEAIGWGCRGGGWRRVAPHKRQRLSHHRRHKAVGKSVCHHNGWEREKGGKGTRSDTPSSMIEQRRGCECRQRAMLKASSPLTPPLPPPMPKNKENAAGSPSSHQGIKGDCSGDARPKRTMGSLLHCRNELICRHG